MITYLIGLVDEVRPVKNTNRQTGEITQTLEVTVTYSYRFISAGQRGNFLIVADDIQIETFDKSPFAASTAPAASKK